MAKSQKIEQESHVVRIDRERNRGREAKKRQFFALAERFRNEQDPEAADRLGNELGQMISAADWY